MLLALSGGLWAGVRRTEHELVMRRSVKRPDVHFLALLFLVLLAVFVCASTVLPRLPSWAYCALYLFCVTALGYPFGRIASRGLDQFIERAKGDVPALSAARYCRVLCGTAALTLFITTILIFPSVGFIGLAGIIFAAGMVALFVHW